MMRTRVVLALLALGVLVLAAIPVATVYTAPVDNVLIRALGLAGEDPLRPLTSAIARVRVSSWRQCPSGDFGPQSVLGFVVAAFDRVPGDRGTQVRAVAKALIDAGCDINQYNSLGFAPIHDAVLYGDADLVTILLELKANPRLPVQAPKSNVANPRRAELNGKNALELARHFSATAKSRTEQRQAVIEVLARALGGA